MEEIDTPFTFTVRRHTPELITPAKPTPHELKPLSDIDQQEIFRWQVPVVLFYRRNPELRNKNPASVIREALSNLLVFYYPFAGRIKEDPAAGKLMVDCSGEGILFIEAVADVTLEQFGDAFQPPMEELLYDVPGSSGILDSPLLLIQVTRLLCGGFIFALRMNHTMSDAVGIIQFLSGLGELARGATSPSTFPVWQRELFCSTDRPHTRFTHCEYDQVVDSKESVIPQYDIVHKSLFITTTMISTLRRLVPTHLQSCSPFEVLTACIWRCHTIASQPDPEEDMPVILTVNARKMFNNPQPPIGYYGNFLAFPAAISKARDLCNKPLGYALELVMKAKSEVTKKNIRSVTDLMAFKGPVVRRTALRPYIVSDLTRAGWDAVDFGWGKPKYGGATRGGIGTINGLSNFFVSYTNNKGVSGIVIPMRLPSEVMDRFVREVNKMLSQGKNDEGLVKHKSSAL